MDIWLNKDLYCVNKEYTIFQLCAIVGQNLPCFCYHEKLTIAGNCRVCLVEVESSVNLVASCAMPIMDGMVIETKSKRVIEAREAVLEFLLLNHPLDCPICDQAGECDLQDLDLTIGSDYSRYDGLIKRAVDNLNCLGPLVKTVMTRCIHCTRCVRFSHEVSGSYDFGLIGRGSFMEINAINDYLSDELLGNVIDLCPVGALTSMPYAFKQRPWELKHVPSIDILDSLGSSIRIDIANNSIVRVVPYLDESVNEEWITNKARFSYDALNAQRVYYPYLRIDFMYVQFSWNKIFDIFAILSHTARDYFIEAYCSSFSSIESLVSIKSYFNSMGCYNIYYNDGNILNFIDFKYYYLLNDTLINLEDKFNILFIGMDSRLEIPVLNSRLRKNFLRNIEFRCYSIGLAINYSTYPVINLGNTAKTLFKFIEGKLSYIRNMYLWDFLMPSIFNYNSLNLDIFVGTALLNRIDNNGLLNSLYNMISFNNLAISNINIISSHLGRISMSDVGLGYILPSNYIYSRNISTNKFIYLCGADTENLLNGDYINKSDFVIYLGPYSPVNYYSDKINIVIPTSIYTEENANYLNLEGRLRKSVIVLPSKSHIRSLSDIFNSLYYIRSEWALDNYSRYENFFSYIINNIDINYKFHYDETLRLILNTSKIYTPFVCNVNVNLLFKHTNIFIGTIFDKNIFNYYMSDTIVLNSSIMANCASKIRYINFRSSDLSNIKF